MSRDLSVNSVQISEFRHLQRLFFPDSRRVLFQTSVGRKRKLSIYRSKNVIYLKKHKVIMQKNSAFDQNYTKLIMETGDEELDVMGLGESTAEEPLDSDSTDSDGFDHLPGQQH